VSRPFADLFKNYKMENDVVNKIWLNMNEDVDCKTTLWCTNKALIVDIGRH